MEISENVFISYDLRGSFAGTFWSIVYQSWEFIWGINSDIQKKNQHIYVVK